jgi:LysR family glycine cleavage system transcriptional activator
LRAFEAAARHEGFQQAAQELAVSPGAVAQQVKKLEEWVGGRLFERHAQGVSLTPLGRSVLPDLTRGLDLIGRASQRLRLGAGRSPIRIAALPAIAQLLLSPLLPVLRDGLGGNDISIHALEHPPQMDRGMFDLAVYPMDRDADGERSVVQVAENWLTPVAAPSIADAIRDAEDLERAQLIHDSTWSEDWATWLRAERMGGPDPHRGATHSLYSIAVDRCVAGDGVLIGHSALIGPHLAVRSLKPVFPGRAVRGPSIVLSVSTQEPDDAQLGRMAEGIRAGCAGPASDWAHIVKAR